MPRLGVNIDHIATLRQVRGVSYPLPLAAVDILQRCNVHQVTMHLREDRRHIQDHDVVDIIKAQILPVNLEMAVTEEMVGIACSLKPQNVTFVPEKRQELTTEGGLDCVKYGKKLSEAFKEIKKHGVRVSLFIEAVEKQVRMAGELGADAIEIHTGRYCNLSEEQGKVDVELSKIREMSLLARSLKLKVYAGHGLHVGNLRAVVQIKEIEEYNIGHAIIAKAIFIGLEGAVREIQDILQ